ncbi:hypothetical protein ACET3Z_000387 [Daucus carota]
MGTNITDEKEKKMFIGVIWSCAAEVKILCTALLFLCSLLTIFQFFPSPLSFVSVSDLRKCVSAIPTSPPPPQPIQLDHDLQNGVIKRSFDPRGAAAYNFILMSAYRGGASTFAINGLSSKPLHVFGNPSYKCEYVPHNVTHANESIIVDGNKILPDWGYGRVYTTVVVNCTFPVPVGESGGKLVLRASTNGGGDTEDTHTDIMTVLDEGSKSVNFSIFTEPPKYDYLYCGSSLYGNLSPQRVREWIAYHVRMFGEKSHFVIHDAGGVHPEVMEVLRPWMDRGFVTLQDIRDEERFDGYYHNQFLVVNDCLHRYRFMAKWMFFFDVDEFIYVPKDSNLKSVVDSLSEYTQFTIEQRTMSNKLCLTEDEGKEYRKWGFEKLMYRDIKRGIRRDRKYAIQPRNVFATGVHLSQNFAGKTTHKTEGRITYYHYHGTISERNEPCRQLVNETNLKLDATPYVMDTSMRDAAVAVKRFELKMIGSGLQNTRQ